MALSNQGSAAKQFSDRHSRGAGLCGRAIRHVHAGQTVVNFFKTTQNSLIATPYTFHSQS